jgi:hypothetical protein
MDAEVQTDDLPLRHGATDAVWKPITIAACGSNFVSTSALTAESAKFGVRLHTADACD